MDPISLKRGGVFFIQLDLSKGAVRLNKIGDSIGAAGETLSSIAR